MAVDPAKVCDGKPCKRCGETLRWRSSQNCVNCSRERLREKRRTDPEWAERQRERRRERQREWYRKRIDESFIFRAEEGMRKRRHSALKRMEARHERDGENPEAREVVHAQLAQAINPDEILRKVISNPGGKDAVRETGDPQDNR